MPVVRGLARIVLKPNNLEFLALLNLQQLTVILVHTAVVKILNAFLDLNFWSLTTWQSVDDSPGLDQED